ncbi:MAG: molecular chaperone DnaK [Bdellovibrionaceae bacterium]|nr:molecular chaperone DnaK [Pseudobdellovibrionaceae bacterium]
MDREQAIEICKMKLIEKKSNLLNRIRNQHQEFLKRDSTSRGDEGDQSMGVINEHQHFVSHHLLRNQLLEVEQALGRIESNSFGICEETLEEIETARLLAIPWTRLSLEGAELREAK